MLGKRVLAVVLFAGVLGGTLALSKAADLGILLKAGRKAHDQVRNVLPESKRFTEPLAAFRVNDIWPVEDRVAVRLQTDKSLQGATITVAGNSAAGAVKLKGVVQTTAQKDRAQELATSTAGVEAVVNELAVPEGK
jgi:osmotically-inducible protein OsmY